MKAPPRAPSAQRLAALVAAFAGRRVAVLGDLLADEFAYGDIVRVSREAPVLILEHRETALVPGGAGNAVVNLRALDARPLPLGVVGRDPVGQRLVRLLRGSGIPTTGIRAVAGRSTPTKTRIVAGGVHTRRQQVVRMDRGARRGELGARERAALERRARVVLERAEGLLVADYGYGAAGPESVRVARAATRSTDLPVFVDSRFRVAEYGGISACTPNQEELEDALGLPPLRDVTEVERAARQLLRRCRGGAVLVTRGSRGMSLIERGRPPRHIPPHGTEEVADVTGAGDTVIAVFSLACLAGATFLEAAHLANIAAGLVVMKAGTATVSRGEMLEAIREAPR